MSARNACMLVACTGFVLLALGVRAAEPEADEVDAAIAAENYTLAAELLREELVEAPADEPARFTLARVLGWGGDYEAALSEYDALLEASPDNVDYSLGRAHVLAWDGRDGAALEELARARSLAPSYEAVWRLELSLLERSAGNESRIRALRDRAAQRFPEARWWRERAETRSAEATTELTVGAVHQALSRAVPDWSAFSMRVTRQRDADSSFYGALSREQRFDRADVVIGAGGSWALSEHWTTGVDLDIGADTDFLPRGSVAGWAARALPSGWEARFRLRQRRYSADEVTSTAITAGRYFGDFRVAYTYDRSRLHDEASFATHIAALNYFHSERTRINVTIAEGQEAEAIAPGRVLRTDVRGISVGAQHGLGERWRLSWWLGAHRQGELYRRRYVGFSLATGL